MLIEKNIPMPVKGKGNEIDSFVAQMEVGDSVFIQGYKNRGSASLAFVGAAYRKNLTYKFTSAVEGDGFRVWRKV